MTQIKLHMEVAELSHEGKFTLVIQIRLQFEIDFFRESDRKKELRQMMVIYREREW